MQNRHLMRQARRMRHFARIANCRVRQAWFMKPLLCVMQAGGGGGGGEGTKISHIRNIHLKKCIKPKQGKKYTQDKQTNTQKMKHAPTEP